LGTALYATLSRLYLPTSASGKYGTGESGRRPQLGSSPGNFQAQVYPAKKTDWGTVRRVGIDEVSQRKGHKDFVTVVCDVDQSHLLEVIDSHKQTDIIEVLLQQPLELRQQVEEVSIDMWGGFPKVVAAVFLNGQIVFDRFHVMKPVKES
jgi:transposase